jgi:hypothetical protein
VAPVDAEQPFALAPARRGGVQGREEGGRWCRVVAVVVQLVVEVVVAEDEAGPTVQVDLLGGQVLDGAAHGGLAPPRPPREVLDGGRSNREK